MMFFFKSRIISVSMTTRRRVASLLVLLLPALLGSLALVRRASSTILLNNSINSGLSSSSSSTVSTRRTLAENGAIRGGTQKETLTTTRKNETPRMVQTPKPPLVTFIIPATLTRDTINNTIASLQAQTRDNWRAIVGVDVRLSPIFHQTPNMIQQQLQEEPEEHHPKHLETPQDQLLFQHVRHLQQRGVLPWNERRLSFVPVTTASSDRGTRANGAGDVRNMVIQHHATTPWVALVDDDDALHPRYLEMLEQAIRNPQPEQPEPLLLLFRMSVTKQGEEFIEPPRHTGNLACRGHLGISFAVQRKVFLQEQAPSKAPSKAKEKQRHLLAFTPGRFEDFDFLMALQKQQQEEEHRAARQAALSQSKTEHKEDHPATPLTPSLYITDCTGYYVKPTGQQIQDLIQQEQHNRSPLQCTYQKAVISKFWQDCFPKEGK